jgi:hypothetical protein
MIRVLAFALAGGLVLLAACGGSGDDQAADVTPQATPQATPPWAVQQSELKGRMGEMVLTKEDLPTSLSWLEPAEDPPEALQPIIAPERDPLTMQGLPWRPGSVGPLAGSPWEASAFVGRDGDVWLWSLVTLPADLDTLSAVRRAMVQAADLDVVQLRLDIWDSLTKENRGLKPESVRIGGARGLGDARFAYGLSLQNLQGEEQYQVEGYAFTRGPVFAVLTVAYRPGTLAKDDGLYLALTFDGKIQQVLKAAGLLEA